MSEPGTREAGGGRVGGLSLVLCLLLAALFLWLPTVVRAQGAAPPPPPPAEGLDPGTAPKSSREVSAPTTPLPAGTPSVSAATKGAPPPPAEGLDPATAPASSRETGANPAEKPVPSAGASSTPAPEEESVEVEAPADTSAKASPATVFRLDFMQRALLAGLIVSGTCAFLGIYVILRRVVFVGVALAEMSSAGVAVSLLANIPPMVGSVLTMFAGVMLFSVRWGGRRIRQDAFIGIGYVVASAAAVLLLAKSPSGEGSLLDLLFGNILTVTSGDITATAIALCLTLIFHFLFYKEILFVTFDPDTASASGYQSRIWDMWLYLTIGLTIAFSIHAVGVLMTFASLVIPPVTALLLTRRMHTAFGVAVAVGVLPVPIGLYLSFIVDLPAAATIVVVSFVFLVIAGIVSRFRG